MSPLGATARKRAPGTRASTDGAKRGGTLSALSTSNGAERIEGGTWTLTGPDAPGGIVPVWAVAGP